MVSLFVAAYSVFFIIFSFLNFKIQGRKEQIFSPWKKYAVQSQCRQFIFPMHVNLLHKSMGNSQFLRTTSKWLRTPNPTCPATIYVRTVPWRRVSTEGQRWRGGRRSRRPGNSPARCRQLHTPRHTVSPWTPQTSGDWREVVRKKISYSLHMKYCFSEGKICSLTINGGGRGHKLNTTCPPSPSPQKKKTVKRPDRWWLSNAPME